MNAVSKVATGLAALIVAVILAAPAWPASDYSRARAVVVKDCQRYQGCSRITFRSSVAGVGCGQYDFSYSTTYNGWRRVRAIVHDGRPIESCGTLPALDVAQRVAGADDDAVGTGADGGTTHRGAR